MPQHTQVEIERKYDVDADTTPPALVGVGAVAVQAEPETAELVATYLDTADLTLANARIAVRVRRGGHDEGWHVKLAPGEEGRVELHWALSEGDGDEPPVALREAVGQALGDLPLGDLPLAPIARIVNTRVTTVLRDAAGFDLAELCDDHVRGENLRSGGSESWREWEVELLSGAPDTPAGRTALLDGIEERLLAAGARPAASDSKLQRVLSL
ncbi:CYTH domain-containing protein [Leifsonia sp. F6_8S_P_1B]|uniref:CYTH domain-containing protein n=1 Tax=Leifsonia williamsii TaxID=3035919 RepID=A0ABT8KBC0_9MICO|nr:CYTH domain-containing protein [Leifsonia williamsii]MDN4614753.1 CYTH domain-containing protein [Leifsonia williamsii]